MVIIILIIIIIIIITAINFVYSLVKFSYKRSYFNAELRICSYVLKKSLTLIRLGFSKVPFSWKGERSI